MSEENKNNVIFVDGMSFKLPRENCPDFIRGHISIKCESLIAFLMKHDKNGWINCDMCKSKKGNIYFKLNTWEKPSSKGEGSAVKEVSDAEKEEF